jgi:hypothetical protein
MIWTVAVAVYRDGDGDSGRDGGDGDDENDKTVKMAEMVREAADNENGR